MPTDTRALPSRIETDANFRTWGSGINAQLVACGLVQTADTGQIDWVTVSKPASTDTVAGYEIWRFDDTLQATSPVFIRIEFSSASSATMQQLNLKIGTATDGAGTFVGYATDNQLIYPGYALGVGQTRTSYCSGDDGRIALVLNYNPSSPGTELGFFVDRARDGTGTSVGAGTQMMTLGSARNCQLLPSVGTPTYSESTVPSIGGYSSQMMYTSYGGDVALVPFIYILGRLYWGSNALYRDGDFVDLVPLTATHLGATRTFLPLEHLGDLISGSSYTAHLALLWE